MIKDILDIIYTQGKLFCLCYYTDGVPLRAYMFGVQDGGTVVGVDRRELRVVWSRRLDPRWC